MAGNSDMKQAANNGSEFKSKLRKGDEVYILAGRSRGETGTIEEIDKKKCRVYVSGKNLGKRHQKPGMQNQEGGFIDIPMPIHVSNVALIDPKSKKPTRVGYKTQDGKKARFARKSGSLL